MSTQMLVCDKTRMVKIATIDNYNGEGEIELPIEPPPSDPAQAPIMRKYAVVRVGFGGNTYLIATRDGVLPENPQEVIEQHQIEPYFE
ncbi:MULTISPECIES: hypothetical protein [Enterobacter cloacae complex]|uniref:hypothetical protein n=1 Tax=Enterobacter cloacae complex TaxID=354276 RepID=UPI00124A59F5|nr:hypothetical protein [Enterobacter asburiae]MCM7695307.1 hypothetical protein [Enterobacter hormaechei]HEB5888589.1 hypothetical protein [Enterobacter asburiae]HEG1825540.1 hypothetical protein [Enterobacter cloacae]